MKPKPTQLPLPKPPRFKGFFKAHASPELKEKVRAVPPRLPTKEMPR